MVQWIIGGTPEAMTLTFARRWMIPSQPEGVVADDQLGYLYIWRSEDGGIWRFDASPTGSTEGTLVDTVGSACLPVDDVEGMGVFLDWPDTRLARRLGPGRQPLRALSAPARCRRQAGLRRQLQHRHRPHLTRSARPTGWK